VESDLPIAMSSKPSESNLAACVVRIAASLNLKFVFEPINACINEDIPFRSEAGPKSNNLFQVIGNRSENDQMGLKTINSIPCDVKFRSIKSVPSSVIVFSGPPL